MSKLIVAAAFAILASGQGASAAEGRQRIELTNDSALQVTSLKTQKNDVWSDNRLVQPVASHGRRELDFAMDSADCRAWTRIDFSDGTYVDADIDYCSTSRITATFRGISWK